MAEGSGNGTSLTNRLIFIILAAAITAVGGIGNYLLLDMRSTLHDMATDIASLQATSIRDDTVLDTQKDRIGALEARQTALDSRQTDFAERLTRDEDRVPPPPTRK